MALDESRDGDEIFNQNGLTFMIEKALLEDVKPIKVDFVETPRGAGYSIELQPSESGRLRQLRRQLRLIGAALDRIRERGAFGSPFFMLTIPPPQ